MKPGRTGLTRVLHATRYSWQGLNAAFKHEAAFRQELALAIILIPAAIWLTSDAVELGLLIGSLLLVLVVELINSAIEAIVDRFGDEIHELSGRAKDIGSAAVFISLLNVALIWGLLLYKHLG
ncbi:MAG: diacylglycerol kinase [Thioalkalispiraceae bacterium]|jgi:diacylglycerol kinase (ATP)